MPDQEMIERVARSIYMTEFPTLVTLESWDEYLHMLTFKISRGNLLKLTQTKE